MTSVWGDCETCGKFSYRGIRRDGLPSTMYVYCDEFGHSRRSECDRHEQGKPRYYDKRGELITDDEMVEMRKRVSR